MSRALEALDRVRGAVHKYWARYVESEAVRGGARDFLLLMVLERGFSRWVAARKFSEAQVAARGFLPLVGGFSTDLFVPRVCLPAHFTVVKVRSIPDIGIVGFGTSNILEQITPSSSCVCHRGWHGLSMTFADPVSSVRRSVCFTMVFAFVPGVGSFTVLSQAVCFSFTVTAVILWGCSAVPLSAPPLHQLRTCFFLNEVHVKTTTKTTAHQFFTCPQRTWRSLRWWWPDCTVVFHADAKLLV